MAQEMEKALRKVRLANGLSELPPGDKDRQMLFIAIANGVINHLSEKASAFRIESGRLTIDVRSGDE